MLGSIPSSSDFCQVKEVLKTKPWLNRLVALICSESYQVLP